MAPINHPTEGDIMNKQHQTPRPTAIILVNELVTPQLQRIFGEAETSSLMIAGHSLIEHTLIELRDLNFEQVIILARHDAKRIQTLIGNTQRWSMTINVMQYRLDKKQVLQDYQPLGEPNGLLIIELDRLRSHCIGDFLTKSEESDYLLLEATSASEPLGITLQKHSSTNFIINAMGIELGDLKSTTLKTTYDFHKANFDVVSGHYLGLEPSVNLHTQTGHRQHWSSYLHKQSCIDSRTSMIERDCHIGRHTNLDSVILNHDVYIEQDSSLKNTIVMPNAVIAKNNNVQNAIINNGSVYTV